MGGSMKDTTTRDVAPVGHRAPRISLVFYFREGARIVEPQRTALVVGRAWPADVVLEDASVSRKHAQFWLEEDGSVRFEDLGSTNGTRLNGVPAKEGRIGPGDELRIGEVSVALHVLTLAAGAQGLIAHDRLLEIAATELVRARTFGRPLAILMVAARAPGHPLPTWAPALIEQLRPVDRAAVYANDAVLVALAESTRQDAESLAATIRERAPALGFGIAVFPDDGRSVDELIEVARTALTRAPTDQTARSQLVGGERSRALWELVERVAPSHLPVLVVGETGTGKEVVARMLHRRSGPLTSVNCAAIPTSLVESVLFGHEKGAFTGAERQSKGLFEQAHGGTLFLDEIGELPLGAQAALLRALETKTIVRVGGEKEIAVDVRVIAATHRDLEAMAREGSFRSDLFYRLHGLTLSQRQERERSEEVAPLADAFLRDACASSGRVLRGIEPSALDLLVRWRWPGNVRELKNVIERAVVIARGETIAVEDLPERMRASAELPVEFASTSIPRTTMRPLAADEDYRERIRKETQRYETELILSALAEAKGNVSAAARSLKIPLRTLTHKMSLFGIKRRVDW
jgi:two-component system, NtrC family, response regulator AtoC